MISNPPVQLNDAASCILLLLVPPIHTVAVVIYGIH